jgi:ferritin
MSNELLDLMQAHLNLERQSAAAYFAAAVWFAERELVGFAEHMRDEAKQEEQHAAKFADYLISRGQRAVLDTVEPPRQQWPDIEQVIANVFRMEADVTASVLQLYGNAENDQDVRTTVFLDPIVDGQRLSEHEAAYLLGRVKFAANNPAALMIIDAELREGEAEPAKLEG